MSEYDPGEPLGWNEDEERPRERSMSRRTITGAKNVTQHPYVALVTALATAAGGYWAYDQDQTKDSKRERAGAIREIEARFEDKYWKQTAEDYHADMIGVLEEQNKQIEALREAIEKLAAGQRTEARRITSRVIESKPMPMRALPPARKPKIDPEQLKLESLRYLDELEALEESFE